MKSKINTVYFIFGLALTWAIFTSSSGGKEGAWAGAPGDSGTCSTCHTSSGSGSITLSGAPSSYDLGQTYNMTLTINDAGASVGGFQIIATNGSDNTLVGSFSPSAGQKLNDINRLVQSSPQAFSGGSTSWPVSWTAPSGSGPTNVQFFFVGNAANGNGSNGAGDNGYAGISAMIPLPVELISFKANYNRESTILKWTVADELDFSHYEIERSRNSSDFETIGKINPSSEASLLKEYQFVDESPHLNSDNYYRLKMVDLDNSFEYSPIRSVSASKQKENNFTLYPNPVNQNSNLNLKFNSKEWKNSDEIRLLIYNSSGVVNFQKNITVSSDDQIQIPTDRFPSGIYMLTMTDDNETYKTERFIVN